MMYYLRAIKVALLFITILVLSYNFHVADQSKYEADGDAADFITLGVSLAAFQKYGQVKMENGEMLLTAFKNKNVKKENLEFIGHSTWRPPLWPSLIGCIFLVFGFNLTYLIVFKFLLHIIGIYLFNKTLKLVLRQPILIIFGTFLYAVSPAWQLYSRVFLSEPVTMFFITAWTYSLIKYLKVGRGFLLQSLLGGLLVLSHPYYLFLPFFTWLILWIRKSFNFKNLAYSSLIAAGIIVGWIFRNAVVLETNQLILTTSSGAVLAKGWNKDVVRMHTNTQGDLAEEELVLLNFQPQQKYQKDEIGRMLRYKDATYHFIKKNPDMIFPIIGKKLKSAFNPFPETPRPGILENMRWVFHLVSLIALLYIVFFVSKKILPSLALGLILSTITMTVLTYSGFRFRMPQIVLELLFIIYVLQELGWRNSKFINGD